MKYHALWVSLSLLLALPLPGRAVEFTAAELARASALQKTLVTLDSHLDTPANFARADFDMMVAHPGNKLSQVDYPRMVQGALDGGFWAVYTGQGDRSARAHLEDRDAGLQRLSVIHQLLAAHPDKFEEATTPADAARIKARGKRIVYISMENASPLVHDPSLLSFYYKQGLRLMSVALLAQAVTVLGHRHLTVHSSRTGFASRLNSGVRPLSTARQLETLMVELFDNDETGYLKWVQANPHGFVANVDRAGTVPQYPMVHAATHGSIFSQKIGDFTTGAYVKFCCTDLDAMEQYSQTKFGRSLTRCSQCM